MSDNIIKFPDKNAPDPEFVFIDELGNKWFKFLVSFEHESIDPDKKTQKFEFDVWALNQEDADKRLLSIRSNAHINGQVLAEEDF